LTVVTRESVRLFLLIEGLNDLDILTCNVQNMYLNGPDNVGKPVLIVQALNGLQSSGAMWRQHMVDTLTETGFQSCKTDTNVWMRPATKENGKKYYKYILCYVDDILCSLQI
jgi:hypothetical protein